MSRYQLYDAEGQPFAKLYDDGLLGAPQDLQAVLKANPKAASCSYVGQSVEYSPKTMDPALDPALEAAVDALDADRPKKFTKAERKEAKAELRASALRELGVSTP